MTDGFGPGPGVFDPFRRKHHHHHKLPDFSWIEIYSIVPSDSLYVRARIGDGDIGQSGGGAGWQGVQRPQKRPLVSWRGASESLTIKVPIIIDGLTDDNSGRSVEDDVRQLEIMAGIDIPGDPKPPLVVFNANGAIQHDATHNPRSHWVISPEPEFGSALRRRSDGARVRQEATVTFLHFATDDSLSRAKQISRVHYTIAKQGDTYNKIAARALKAYGGVRWGNRLAYLNGARDGASKPKVGQIVKLPTPQQIEEWKRKPRR